MGGLTRSVVLDINEDGESMAIAAPEIEEVFVVASFDPAGLEVSERDTANIVDTIGVELLTRYADSDVAAAAVRVPRLSVEDAQYAFTRGCGGWSRGPRALAAGYARYGGRFRSRGVGGTRARLLG